MTAAKDAVAYTGDQTPGTTPLERGWQRQRRKVVSA
jgi:hypothetical protein